MRLGAVGTPLVVTPGMLVTTPPMLVHAFVNRSSASASWLNIHAPDGGFAAFLRGIRDGVAVSWDAHPPVDEGLDVGAARIVADSANALAEFGVQLIDHDETGVRIVTTTHPDAAQ